MKGPQKEKAYILVEMEYGGRMEDDEAPDVDKVTGAHVRPVEFMDLTSGFWTVDIDNAITTALDDVFSDGEFFDLDVKASVLGLLRVKPQARVY